MPSPWRESDSAMTVIVDDAAGVVDRAGARLKLSAEHTVVGLHGQRRRELRAQYDPDQPGDRGFRAQIARRRQRVLLGSLAAVIALGSAIIIVETMKVRPKAGFMPDMNM